MRKLKATPPANPERLRRMYGFKPTAENLAVIERHRAHLSKLAKEEISFSVALRDIIRRFAQGGRDAGYDGGWTEAWRNVTTKAKKGIGGALAGLARSIGEGPTPEEVEPE